MAPETDVKKLPAVVEHHGVASPPALLESRAALVSALWSSWAINTQADKLMLARVRTSDADSLWDLLPCQVEAINAIAFPRELLDKESGELTIKVITVLIDAEGNALASASSKIYDAVRVHYEAVGPGPWATPLKLDLKRKPIGDGKYTYAVKVLP